MPPEKPSDLELQILGLLWRNGPATVRDLLDKMPDGKKRAYTSLLSALQVMEKKGLVSREREGLTDRWRPLVTESGIIGPFFRNLVANVFDGKATHAMQHLLRETEVDAADLAEIRRLLDAHSPKHPAAGTGAKAKGKRK